MSFRLSGEGNAICVEQSITADWIHLESLRMAISLMALFPLQIETQFVRISPVRLCKSRYDFDSTFHDFHFPLVFRKQAKSPVLFSIGIKFHALYSAK